MSQITYRSVTIFDGAFKDTILSFRYTERYEKYYVICAVIMDKDLSFEKMIDKLCY